MVADGVHILLGVALVSLLLRTDRVEPYLIVILAAGVPDLDRYLFTPFLYSGYLSGAIWRPVSTTGTNGTPAAKGSRRSPPGSLSASGVEPSDGHTEASVGMRSPTTEFGHNPYVWSHPKWTG